MQYRRLGRTNLRVSLIGLGSGGRSRLGQRSNSSHSQIVGLIHRALDLGVNYIDTAADYGDSESLIGEALVGRRRESVVLSTKFFPTGLGGPMKRTAELRPSLERSLRRLRTEYVDVFFLHGVPVHAYREVLDRFLDELRTLQQAGLIRYIGVTEQNSSDHEHEMLSSALADDIFDVIMVTLNLLSPAAATTVLPLASERDVGVVVMCAVRSVISNPDLLRQIIRDWKRADLLPAGAVADYAPLDWVLGPGVESLTDAAYKFAAEPAGVSSVLTGTGSIQHLEENIRAALGPALPRDVSQRLRDLFGPVGLNVDMAHSVPEGWTRRP